MYTVQAQDSDSMNILGAIGNCLLAFTSEFEIICALLPDKQVVGVWPLHSLRRYWCEDGVFAFEAGRRSPRGEGTYSFVTSHNEEIYRNVDRLVQKARRASSSSGSGSVDERPPAPLPAGAHTPETPVPSSESDEEKARYTDATPTPSKVPQPQASSGAKTTASQPNHTPDVSGNPTYTVRARSGSSWLHQSVQRSPKAESSKPKRRSVHNQPLPPPPIALIGDEIQSRDPLEEDTYSHTVHHVPAPFQQSQVNASLYNALSHPQDPSIKRQPRSTTVDESALYDIAFPPSTLSKGWRMLPQDAEYGIVGDAKPDIIPGTTMPVNKLPLSLGKPKELPKAKQPLNPLYGSQEDLLRAPEAPLPEAPSSEVPSPRLARLPTGSGQRPEFLKSPQLPRDDTDDAPPPGPLRKKTEDDGLTANPLYGSHDQLLDVLKQEALEESMEVDPTRWYKPPEDENVKPATATTVRAANPVYGDITPAQGGDTGANDVEDREKTPMEGREQATDQVTLLEDARKDSKEPCRPKLREPTPDPSVSGVPRDAKGYSKIDKSKKQKQKTNEEIREVEPDDAVAPPPIPQRTYSSPVPESPSPELAQLPTGSEAASDDAVDPPPIPQRNYSWDSSNSTNI